MIVERLNAAGFGLPDDAAVDWAPVGRHRVGYLVSADAAFFLKCRGDPLVGGAPRLDAEAAFHRAVAAGAFPAAVTEHVPKLRWIGGGSDLLVFDAWLGRVSLERRISQGPPVSAVTWETLAVALAALHETRDDRAANGRRAELCTTENPVSLVTRPGVSDLAHGPRLFTDVARMLQSDRRIDEALIDLRAAWTASAPVHGDLKADNILLDPVDPSAIGLVDWELAGIGDPRWDLAALAGSTLLASLPSAVSSADGSLSTSLAGLRAFAAGYDRAARRSIADEAVTRWAGAFILKQVVASLGAQRHLLPLHLAAIHLAAALLIDGTDDRAGSLVRRADLTTGDAA